MSDNGDYERVVQEEGWGEVHMTHHYTKDITGWAQDPSSLPFLTS